MYLRLKWLLLRSFLDFSDSLLHLSDPSPRPPTPTGGVPPLPQPQTCQTPIGEVSTSPNLVVLPLAKPPSLLLVLSTDGVEVRTSTPVVPSLLLALKRRLRYRNYKVVVWYIAYCGFGSYSRVTVRLPSVGIIHVARVLTVGLI